MKRLLSLNLKLWNGLNKSQQLNYTKKQVMKRARIFKHAAYSLFLSFCWISKNSVTKNSMFNQNCQQHEAIFHQFVILTEKRKTRKYRNVDMCQRKCGYLNWQSISYYRFMYVHNVRPEPKSKAKQCFYSALNRIFRIFF